jgi:sugar/nucleoside kinase (ribokinase family)
VRIDKLDFSYMMYATQLDPEERGLITILCDVLADIGFYVEAFPITAESMARSRELHITSGGATNVAITAARLGLVVQVLGEVGDDAIGDIVLRELEKEGIDATGIVRSHGATTPVAGVVVDHLGEAGYIGYPGTLVIEELTDDWRARIAGSQALFADGWADHEAVADIVLEGFRVARDNGVPSFFDPGPGNPDFERGWHKEAARLASVILATEAEASWLSGLNDIKRTAETILNWGPELVVIKRGPGGCLLTRDGQFYLSPSFPVEILDNTGAGDALDAAVINAYLKGFDLERMGALANAAGAAKARKRGTGRNMPKREEIEAVMAAFGQGF